jgi:hypothetical protein
MDHNLVPFGDGVVNSEFAVGKTIPTHGDVASKVVYARLEGGEDGIVVRAVLRDEFPEFVQLSQVPAVVHVPVHDLLIG